MVSRLLKNKLMIIFDCDLGHEEFLQDLLQEKERGGFRTELYFLILLLLLLADNKDTIKTVLVLQNSAKYILQTVTTILQTPPVTFPASQHVIKVTFNYVMESIHGLGMGKKTEKQQKKVIPSWVPFILLIFP